MRSSVVSLLFAVLVPLLVSAAPLQRGVDPGTVQVLQFAFVLENLETEFYRQALAKFKSSDFNTAGFSSADIAIEQFTAIQFDESSHVSVLETTLIAFGEQPVKSCQFNFDSVLKDVATMATVARVVENVGVGAYLGAAHLVQDPRVLTAAASIVTIEARHQTMLNILQTGSAIPQAFDIPLLPQEVLAIAGSFISGCDLGIKANPALTVTNTGTVAIGTKLEFSSPALNDSRSNFHCQMLVGGAPFSITLPIDNCVVPEGINGAVAVWITSDDQPLNGGAVDRVSNAIVAGPLMTFIDSQQELLGSLVRSGQNNSSPEGGSSSTTTVNPEQASSILSSLSTSTTSSEATTTSSGAEATTTTTSSGADAATTQSSSPAPGATTTTGSEPAALGGSTPSPTSSPATPGSGGVVVQGLSMVPMPTLSA
ncbi:ferritin-like domain-containing protein [Russula brevipes]|nr:ferritin-like domain-containing protein [Russula brevipes]